ncbi:hypothetical protein JXO59_05295, partial [candidate division KSB1 bacterium]|nr:hypothetical protein [candidate division KSB1 bacterium]
MRIRTCTLWPNDIRYQTALFIIITFLTAVLPFAGAHHHDVARQAQTTLHILALRAEFQTDDVATTTGDGRFDLSTGSDYHLDRPPHNRLYFQQQLTALHNYFSHISRGKVRITADVYPLEDNQVYVLPNDMVYYSGREDEQLKQKGWAELLRDALQVAAAQDGIDFAQYQCVVVFHAGVGQDFAFDFDTTPYDIQSVYIDFGTLQSGLAPQDTDFKGIEVPDSVYITEGIILPETQNQEGYDLGLLGSMTLMMGSRLGMPSLFDTESGRAGIGRWGLMDQGSFNFQGFVPAEPSAWEKVYMGWETPLIVRNGEQIRIGSSSTKSAPHIFKVPVTEHEYFLIENRQNDINGDRITIGRDEYGRKAEFDSTGRVVAPADIGVLTRIDEYDYGLPGSGILIWHIDEQVIQAGLASNTVNNNRDHRGVDLVECDGAQDIGYVYDLFDAAYGAENGDYWDAYWRGNESHKIVNASEDVSFSPVSIPNSHTYTGANSHIRIDTFSERDTIMTFNVHSEFNQPGFPRSIGHTFSAGALLATSARDGRSGVLIGAAKDGGVYAYLVNGDPLFSGGQHWVAAASDSVRLSPALGDLDDDGVDELVVVDAGGAISGWRMEDKDGDAMLDLSFQYQQAIPFSAGPMILRSSSSNDPLIILGDADGLCYLYAPYSSSQIASLNLSEAAVCGLAACSQGDVDFVATTEDGGLYACQTEPAL